MRVEGPKERLTENYALGRLALQYHIRQTTKYLTTVQLLRNGHEVTTGEISRYAHLTRPWLCYHCTVKTDMVYEEDNVSLHTRLLAKRSVRTHKHTRNTYTQTH